MEKKLVDRKPMKKAELLRMRAQVRKIKTALASVRTQDARELVRLALIGAAYESGELR